MTQTTNTRTIEHDGMQLTIDMDKIDNVTATVGQFVTNRSADRDAEEALEKFLDFLADAGMYITGDAYVLEFDEDADDWIDAPERVNVEFDDGEIDWEWSWVTFDDGHNGGHETSVVEYIKELLEESDMPDELLDRAQKYIAAK